MVYLSHEEFCSGPPKASSKAVSTFQMFFVLKLLAVDFNLQKLTEAQLYKPDFSRDEAIFASSCFISFVS